MLLIFQTWECFNLRLCRIPASQDARYRPQTKGLKEIYFQARPCFPWQVSTSALSRSLKSKQEHWRTHRVARHEDVWLRWGCQWRTNSNQILRFYWVSNSQIATEQGLLFKKTAAFSTLLKSKLQPFWIDFWSFPWDIIKWCLKSLANMDLSTPELCVPWRWPISVQNWL